VEQRAIVKMNQRASSAGDKAELIKWWDAVDILRSRMHGLIEGVELARLSQHPDAVWLCSVAASRGTGRLREALEDEERDGRTLFFLSRFESGSDMVKKAAELGYAPAEALMALLEKEAPSGLAWAEAAAAQNDRNGLARLGEFLTKGAWGRMEKERGRAALQLAAELGQREAMLALWKDEAYPTNLRYRWLCRAASCGSHWASLEVVSVALPAVERGELVGPPLLELGGMLAGRLDSSDTQILGLRDPGTSIRTALQCMALYHGWVREVRAAIRTWTGVARRAGVVKDVRVLVARRLWEERDAWMAAWSSLVKLSPSNRKPEQSVVGCVVC
jgi:hypothetical protein